MDLIINHTSMEPIYEQIMIQIKSGIIEGTLTAGEALPSVRALSRELKISALTVKKAYDSLEEEGLVIRKEYVEVPIRVEYSTTTLCDRLMPILESLSDWGEALMQARGLPTVSDAAQAGQEA